MPAFAKFKVPAGNFRFTYRDVDISSDLASLVTEVVYTESANGKSSSLEITLADFDKRWAGPWYPTKQDTIGLIFGLDNATRDAGLFSIDSLKISGPPATMTIRALGTPVGVPLRTSDSYPTEEIQYDDMTTLEVVNTVAARLKLKVVSPTTEREAALINQVWPYTAQYAMTDVAFLADLADQRGFSFHIQGDTIYFLGKDFIDHQPPVFIFEFGKGIIEYEFEDVSYQTAFLTNFRYYNPDLKEGVSAVQTTAPDDTPATPSLIGDLYGTTTGPVTTPPPGLPSGIVGGILAGASILPPSAFEPPPAEVPNIPAADEHNLVGRPVADTDSAMAQAYGGQRALNDTLKTGTFKIEGNALLQANQVVTFLGFGICDGDYVLIEVTHSFNRADGFITTGKVRRIMPWVDPVAGADGPIA